MVCKKCSATIPDDGTFCPNCGARADGNKVCPNCNKLIPDESIFCTYCGTRIITKKPDSNANETNENQPPKKNEVVVPVTVPVETENVAISVDEKDEDDKPLVKGLVCTQCGSTDIELISDSLGRCNQCNTQIIINTPKEDNYVTNNVTIKVDGSAGDNSIGFFELPKQIDEKTFFANALVEIALDKNTPEDIFILGKFEPVKTEYRQYVIAKGTANMTYSATIGYDRKEQYKEYNKYKNEYEIKTRTVTDWKPFSGKYTGEYVDAAINDNNIDFKDPLDYRLLCLADAKEYNPNTSNAPAPLPPSSNSISKIESGIKAKAKSDCEKKLPGDRKKDFNCNGFVALNIIESHVVPQYILKYKYLGRDFMLKAHSSSKSAIRGNKPSVKSEIEKEIEGNKLVKTFNIITLCALLTSILISILLPIAFKIIFGGVGLASFITYWVIRTKVSKEIYLLKTVKKKTDLVALLKKKGIPVPKKLNGGLYL